MTHITELQKHIKTIEPLILCIFFQCLLPYKKINDIPARPNAEILLSYLSEDEKKEKEILIKLREQMKDSQFGKLYDTISSPIKLKGGGRKYKKCKEK